MLPRLRRRSALFACLLAVVAAAFVGRSAAAATCSGPSVTIDGVVFCGKADGPASAFLGVRYATAPARWTSSTMYTYPPQASPVEAQWPAAICPQPVLTPTPPSCPRLPLGQSEDCFFLNVWQPTGAAPGPNYPVMVFIHGGAFVEGAGSGPEYDGSQLAARGVVVVTLNYRLGAFGFLYLNQPEFAGEQNNFGLRDQIVALDWVQQNIASFGGDPTKVTIFGESAGAMSVGLHALFTINQRPHDFRAAMMESNPLGVQYKDKSQADQLGTTFAQQAGCTQSDPTACLKGLDPCTIVKVENAVMDQTFTTPPLSDQLAWAPIVDGSLVTTQPMTAVESGDFTLPVLLGSNRDEATVFSAIYLNLKHTTVISPSAYTSILQGVFGPANAATIASFSPDPSTKPYSCPITSLNCRTQLDDALTAGLFSCPNRQLARLAKSSTYAYLFYQLNAQCNPWQTLSPLCADQACHGAELPYVFFTPASICGCSFLPKSTPVPFAVAQSMGDYWTSFAAAGAPATQSFGWPQWPPVPRGFEPISTPPYMVFAGAPGVVLADPFETLSSGFLSYCDELWDGVNNNNPGQWDRLLKLRLR